MNARNRTESASIRHEIDHLRHKTVAELKVRYLEVFGEASRSNHKQFLVRRIAWRLQALAQGDLSERARERALSLARDADLRLRAPQGSSGVGRHNLLDREYPDYARQTLESPVHNERGTPGSGAGDEETAVGNYGTGVSSPRSLHGAAGRK